MTLMALSSFSKVSPSKELALELSEELLELIDKRLGSLNCSICCSSSETLSSAAAAVQLNCFNCSSRSVIRCFSELALDACLTSAVQIMCVNYAVDISTPLDI